MYMVGADVADVQRWIAAVYVSAWFHDLYMLHRKISCRSYLVFDTEAYDLDLANMSYEYDLFLSALSSQIKSTYIKSDFNGYSLHTYNLSKSGQECS